MINSVVVFTLDEQRYGIPLHVVERVVRAVEVTPLRQAPANVLGFIDIQGNIVPVLSLRRLLRLVDREIGPEDEFILVKTVRRRLALVVDIVSGVMECAEQDLTVAKQILPGLDFLRGVIRTEDGMILIVNLDEFLSLPEERLLEEEIPASTWP